MKRAFVWVALCALGVAGCSDKGSRQQVDPAVMLDSSSNPLLDNRSVTIKPESASGLWSEPDADGLTQLRAADLRLLLSQGCRDPFGRAYGAQVYTNGRATGDSLRTVLTHSVRACGDDFGWANGVLATGDKPRPLALTDFRYQKADLEPGYPRHEISDRWAGGFAVSFVELCIANQALGAIGSLRPQTLVGVFDEKDWMANAYWTDGTGEASDDHGSVAGIREKELLTVDRPSSSDAATFALVALDAASRAASAASAVLASCDKGELSPEVEPGVSLGSVLVSHLAESVDLIDLAWDQARAGILASASDRIAEGSGSAHARIEAMRSYVGSRLEAASVLVGVSPDMFDLPLTFAKPGEVPPPPQGIARPRRVNNGGGRLIPLVAGSVDGQWYVGPERLLRLHRVKEWRVVGYFWGPGALQPPGTKPLYWWYQDEQHYLGTELPKETEFEALLGFLFATSGTGRQSVEEAVAVFEAPELSDAVSSFGSQYVLTDPEAAELYAAGQWPVAPSEAFDQKVRRAEDLLRTYRPNPFLTGPELLSVLGQALKVNFGAGVNTQLSNVEALLGTDAASLSRAAERVIQEARAIGAPLVPVGSQAVPGGGSFVQYSIPPYRGRRRVEPAYLFAMTEGRARPWAYENGLWTVSGGNEVGSANEGDFYDTRYARRGVTHAVEFVAGRLNAFLESGAGDGEPWLSTVRAAHAAIIAMGGGHGHWIVRAPHADWAEDNPFPYLELEVPSHLVEAMDELEFWVDEAGLECALYGTVGGVPCDEQQKARYRWRPMAPGGSDPLSSCRRQGYPRSKRSLILADADAPSGWRLRGDGQGTPEVRLPEETTIYVMRPRATGGREVLFAFAPRLVPLPWGSSVNLCPVTAAPGLTPWLSQQLTDLLAVDANDPTNPVVSCADVNVSERVVLSNSLSSDPSVGPDDRSYYDYLAQAEKFAKDADALGERLFEEGLSADERTEAAAEELEQLCGGVLNIGRLRDAACASSDCDIFALLAASDADVPEQFQSDLEGLRACVGTESSGKALHWAALGDKPLCAWRLREAGASAPGELCRPCSSCPSICPIPVSSERECQEAPKHGVAGYEDWADKDELIEPVFIKDALGLVASKSSAGEVMQTVEPTETEKLHRSIPQTLLWRWLLQVIEEKPSLAQLEAVKELSRRLRPEATLAVPPLHDRGYRHKAAQQARRALLKWAPQGRLANFADAITQFELPEGELVLTNQGRLWATNLAMDDRLEDLWPAAGQDPERSLAFQGLLNAAPEDEEDEDEPTFTEETLEAFLERWVVAEWPLGPIDRSLQEPCRMLARELFRTGGFANGPDAEAPFGTSQGFPLVCGHPLDAGANVFRGPPGRPASESPAATLHALTLTKSKNYTWRSIEASNGTGLGSTLLADGTPPDQAIKWALLKNDYYLRKQSEPGRDIPGMGDVVVGQLQDEDRTPLRCYGHIELQPEADTEGWRCQMQAPLQQSLHATGPLWACTATHAEGRVERDGEQGKVLDFNECAVVPRLLDNPAQEPIQAASSNRKLSCFQYHKKIAGPFLVKKLDNAKIARQVEDTEAALKNALDEALGEGNYGLETSDYGNVKKERGSGLAKRRRYSHFFDATVCPASVEGESWLKNNPISYEVSLKILGKQRRITATAHGEEVQVDENGTVYRARFSTQSILDAYALAWASAEDRTGVIDCESAETLMELSPGDVDLSIVGTMLKCASDDMDDAIRRMYLADLPHDVIESVAESTATGLFPKYRGAYGQQLASVVAAVFAFQREQQAVANAFRRFAERIKLAQLEMDKLELNLDMNRVDQKIETLKELQTEVRIEQARIASQLSQLREQQAIMGQLTSCMSSVLNAYRGTNFVAGNIMSFASAAVTCANSGVQVQLAKSVGRMERETQGLSIESEEINQAIIEKTREKLELGRELTELDKRILVTSVAQAANAAKEDVALAAARANESFARLQSELMELDKVRGKARRLIARALMLEGDDTGRRYRVNRGLRVRAATLRARYGLARRQAIRATYRARRAIEQKIGMELTDITVPIAGSTAPAEWAPRLCSLYGFDYERVIAGGNLPEGVTLQDLVDEDRGFSDQYVGDYVKRLQEFIEAYRTTYHFVDGSGQVVLSVRDHLLGIRESCDVRGPNELLQSTSLWSASWAGVCAEGFCGRARQDVSGSVPEPFACEGRGPGDAAGARCRAMGQATAVQLSYAPQVRVALKGGPPDPQESAQDGAPSAPGDTPQLGQTLWLRPGNYWLSWLERSDCDEPSTVEAVLQVGQSTQRYAHEGGAQTRALCLTPEGADDARDGLTERWLGDGWVRRFHLVKANDPITWVGLKPRADVAQQGEQPVSWVAAPQLERITELQSRAPTEYFPTDEDLSAPVGRCSDEDGSTFRRSDQWQYACETYCPTGFGENCEDWAEPGSLARRCFWEISFPLSVDTLEAGKHGNPGVATGNFNYRHNTVAVNVVGTGVKDCSSAELSSSCYASNFLTYSLVHEGPFRVRNYEQRAYYAPLFPGRIQAAQALLAERYLTNPVSSADDALLRAYHREELKGRPLDGTYTLRLYDDPNLDWSTLQDVQLLLNYRYWTRTR